MYAWACHEIIKKNGKFAGTSTQHIRDKVAYQNYMWGFTDVLEVSGKTFYANEKARLEHQKTK